MKYYGYLLIYCVFSFLSTVPARFVVTPCMNLSNFKKRKIDTIFAKKSRPAFSELYCSPFRFRNY